MTVEDVIGLIKERRERHLPAPIGGDAPDSLRWSEGGFQRAIVQEYDTLLDEIKRDEKNPGSR